MPLSRFCPTISLNTSTTPSSWAPRSSPKHARSCRYARPTVQISAMNSPSSGHISAAVLPCLLVSSGSSPRSSRFRANRLLLSRAAWCSRVSPCERTSEVGLLELGAALEQVPVELVVALLHRVEETVAVLVVDQPDHARVVAQQRLDGLEVLWSAHLLRSP